MILGARLERFGFHVLEGRLFLGRMMILNFHCCIPKLRKVPSSQINEVRVIYSKTG